MHSAVALTVLTVHCVAAANTPPSLHGIALPLNSFTDRTHLITRHENATLHVADAPKQELFHISKHDGSGRVTAMVGSFSIQDDSDVTPGCNAALDRGRQVYYKTAVRLSTYVPGNQTTCPAGCPAGSLCCKDPTAKGDPGACFSVKSCSQMSTAGGLGGGDLLTIDIETGAVVRNETMRGSPHHPPSLAYSPATQLAYGVVPYSYTEYGIFSYDPVGGQVAQLNTIKKSSMDGIGDCIGGVLDGHNTSVLWYQLAQGHKHAMVFVDLKTMKEVQRVPGFYITVKDPKMPGSLLAITNTEPGVALVRLGPGSNTSTTIFVMKTTTLGSDLRAQDQASLAVNDAGTRLWFAASYNVPSGKLYRGIFTLALDASGHNATLQSAVKFFGEPDQKTTMVGRIDWV